MNRSGRALAERELHDFHSVIEMTPSFIGLQVEDGRSEQYINNEQA